MPVPSVTPVVRRLGAGAFTALLAGSVLAQVAVGAGPAGAASAPAGVGQPSSSDLVAPAVTAVTLDSDMAISGRGVGLVANATDATGVLRLEVTLDGGATWTRMAPGERSGIATSRTGSAIVNTRLVKVVAGERHACALAADGHVFCWGSNDQGQLGTGAPTDSGQTPGPVQGITTATDVAAGANHTCAVLADHTVQCWGANDYGQLGDSGMSGFSSTTPVTAMGIQATAIVAGDAFTCAMLVPVGDATQVVCWGDNTYGQLGTSNNVSVSSPQAAVSGLFDATGIAAGAAHACAVQATGAVACWGANASGQLGNNTLADSNAPSTVAGLLPEASVVAAGGDTSCAIVNGETWCWGDNAHDQTAGESLAAVVKMPVHLLAAGSFGVGISVSGDHVCERYLDGTVNCWGANAHGQLGDASTADSAIPVAAAGISSATSVVVGAETAAGLTSFSCATLADGTARCWGTNTVGETGTGRDPQIRLLPVAVSGIATAKQVATGVGFGCALLSDATVTCWGDNAHGQLGDGTVVNRDIPVAVGSLSDAGAIAAGTNHACALLQDGSVWCWGDNAYGELGDGSTTGSSTPVQASLALKAVAIAAGDLVTCALLEDATVACWGWNDFGQLGTGSTAPVEKPAVVPGLTNVTAVATGGYHTCAVITDGPVECWGLGDQGQLGDGSGSSSLSPVIADGVSGAVGLAVGQSHTCAFTSGGSAWCWGEGTAGQLGDGMETSSVWPIEVPGLTGVSAMSAGRLATCAIATEGTPMCWGASNTGATGSGSVTGWISSPHDVPGLDVVEGIATSGYLTCAELPGNTVKCWGYDVSGGAGDGTSDLHVPTPIAYLAPVPAVGAHSVCVRATDAVGNVTPAPVCTPLQIFAPDAIAPTAGIPTVTVRAGASLSGTQTPIRLAWTGADTGSAVAAYHLWRNTGTGWVALTDVVTHATSTGINTTIPSTGTVQYRVQAVDVAGNVSAVRSSVIVVPKLYQQNSAIFTYVKSWPTTAGAAYSGGTEMYSSTAGASVTFKVTGRQLALVMTKGKTRGKVKVYVNGALVATVDTYNAAATPLYRVLAWKTTWATSTTRTIRLVVVGTPGRPRVDLDGIVVLR